MRGGDEGSTYVEGQWKGLREVLLVEDSYEGVWWVTEVSVARHSIGCGS